jgi:uncharacterized protein with ParB-like and HNH nuclease domain
MKRHLLFLFIKEITTGHFFNVNNYFTTLLKLGKNDKTNAHFIGSIVYVHDDVYTASGLTELTIIDGQQRLTTITLIYIALYRLAKELDNQMLVNRIQKTYLINEFAPEEEKLKLKPTENNKEALRPYS